jgi:hypothetical protein
MRLVDSGLSILSNIAGAIDGSVRTAHDSLNGSNFNTFRENNNLVEKQCEDNMIMNLKNVIKYLRRVLCFAGHQGIVWENRPPQWHYWASIDGEVEEQQWRRKCFCHNQPRPR